MAFHVACPITCRRICYCPLGFPLDLHSAKSKADFALHVSRIEDFLSDPLGIRASRDGSATVQVLVPRVEPAAAPPPPPPPQKSQPLPKPQPQPQPQPQQQQLPLVPVVDGGAAGSADVADETKRVAIQKKAVVPEDFARRIQPVDAAVVLKDGSGDEQDASDADALCRLCFVDETEGSERAQRMLSCNTCSKKYHRSCLKGWSKHRDLFHWSSWTCPYCRICEICRRTGDPSKFMFCKRCDDAYHCHCQHPPHKNVGSGPYLCPKHTRCHSCGSSVPGNGLSVRWFLGYTCCDACGRLFVKGNYCPVCLKVYRDSESTPMVCCDICQRWVHCSCDGISDEKYHQFQVDGNLQYKCATCRGECYQVKDLEDAVRELWRRRDIADHELIASLRAAAGLPTQEDIFSIPPYSDEEETGLVVHKNESGRPLKVSLKGLADKSPNKSKEHGKKTSNKKAAKKIGSHASLISKTEPFQNDIQYYGHSVKDNKNDSMQSHGKAGPGMYSSSVAGTMNQPEGVRSTNQTGVLKHKLVDEVMVSDGERTSRVVKIKSNKPHDLDSGDQNENDAYKLKSVKAKKLVINLGPRKINVTNSPKSDASSCQKEQDLTNSNGDTADHSSQLRGLKYARRDGNLKFGRVKSEESNLNPKFDKRGGDGYETASADQDRISAGKRTGDGGKATVATVGEMPTLRSDKSLGKQSAGRPDAYTESNDDSDSLPKDSKFSLKLKIKKPNLERQNPQTSLYEEEKSFIRGLRSKRKRSSTLMEKSSLKEDEEVTESHQDSEMMEASWILKKLGKDAIGKRVEVHQSSNNSWHKGVVSDITEGTSMLSVSLDDGRVKTLELGKQAVRFVSQKQKRSRT